ncbi:amyloid fiber anchoring/assembly protein TapA [Oceanobacillus massiliensis]|uniref:amyloid fiber anchoring/assembly protein TapA n=1 Tax=Oceanobacillus massiliensis TaxID=1465765 RepID=UPI001F2BF548|nr:amyloid fiber anchoring/assembly protein TapA [Oceanobacillus massiliensis]
MRRIRKFQTNKKFRLLLKTLAICYIAFLSLSFLSSNTIAYYNKAKETNFTLNAGTWWDGSELKFTGKGNQNIKSCPETEIAVEIKNIGKSMAGDTVYKVYYAETGNPKKQGELAAEGKIAALAEGETSDLKHMAGQEGFYTFKIIQRPDYEGKSKDEWSEKVKVKCKDEKEHKPEDKKIEEQGKTEEKTVKPSEEQPETSETTEEAEKESKESEESEEPEEPISKDDDSEQEKENENTEKNAETQADTEGNSGSSIQSEAKQSEPVKAEKGTEETGEDTINEETK